MVAQALKRGKERGSTALVVMRRTRTRLVRLRRSTSDQTEVQEPVGWVPNGRLIPDASRVRHRVPPSAHRLMGALAGTATTVLCVGRSDDRGQDHCQRTQMRPNHQNARRVYYAEELCVLIYIDEEPR